MTMNKSPMKITNERTKHQFIICKIPAIVGRELSKEYFNSNLPVIGSTAASTKAMARLLSYVDAVKDDGDTINLGTCDLIENHIEDTEELRWLEDEMVNYNFGFLGSTNPLFSILKMLKQMLEASKGTEMLTPSSDISSTKEQ